MNWVLYDGDCGFCRSAMDLMRVKLEGEGFQFAPLQSEWVVKRLGLGPEEVLSEMKVVLVSGRVLGGAEALVYLAQYYWWGRMLRWIDARPVGRAFLEKSYRWVAERRGCVAGRCVLKKRPRWVGWSPVVGFPLVVWTVVGRMEGWVLMWALAVALFLGCKWLTWWEALLEGRANERSGAYLTRWVGMDARTFLDKSLKPPQVRSGQWLFAVAKTVLGGVLLYGVARMVPYGQPLWQGWVAMVGGIFFMHFGIFHLLALEWQRRGVMAKPIMDAPIAAQSLGEFWGRRWNRGFNDLVRRHSFYPLVPRLGVTGAMMCTFLVSGLIHEVVLSVPARSGYGLPTVYFLLQGLGVGVEKSRLGRSLGLRSGVRGRLFVFLFTLAPAGLLFFPRFVETVVVPFLKAIHAL